MFFALGYYGGVGYRNLHIGGFKTFEAAASRIQKSTTTGIVVNEERRVVAAISKRAVKRNPL